MRLVTIVIVAALLLVCSGGRGEAHAILRETTPIDGARLEAPPAEVRLRFNEPITPIVVQVLDTAGRLIAGTESASVQNDAVRLPLPGTPPTGVYVINYRVTSADGHPSAGSITFGIGVTPPQADALDAPPNRREYATAAAVVLRALHYAALLASLGGGLFLVLVSGPWSALNQQLKPGLCCLLLTAGGTAVLLVGLNGVVLAGGALTDLATIPAWTTGVSSTVGFSMGVALVALLVAAVGLVLEPRYATGRVLLVLGALLGAVSLTLTGHAATAPPRWLSTPLVALHSLMAAYWLGSLWPLAMVLRTEPPNEAARITRRFSRLAIGGVAVLIAAGAGLSALQIGAPKAVLTTEYGWNWLGKMLVVAGLLAMALRNRLVLTPALDHPAGTSVMALRRSVWMEIALAVLVLLLTSRFALTPPPRALSEQASSSQEADYTALITQGNRTALITVTPARPGRNRVTIHLSLPDGAPVTPSEAVLEWETTGVAPQRRSVLASGPGVIEADDIEMPSAGRWSLRLSMPIDGPDKTVFRTEIPIRGSRSEAVSSAPH